MTFRLTSLVSLFVIVAAINMSVYFTSRFVPIVLHRPSYNEVVEFLRQDDTDEHPYTENYTCWAFSATFVQRALDRGLQVGLVYVKFIVYSAHACNCFNTTDRGILYIEPQSDSFVTFDSMPDGSVWFEGQPIQFFDVVW